MKKVEIEQLLRWAIREELPKGRPVSASPWDAITAYAETGGFRVDTGGGHGLGRVPGSPHPDAEIIGREIAALDTAARFNEAECRALLRDYVECDALALRAVACASFNAPALVIRCASLACEMEWDIGAPQPVRENYASNNKPIIFGLDPETGGLTELRLAKNDRWYPLDREPRGMIRWCDPSIGQLLEARAEYVVWHRALEKLTAALAGKLAEHEALPPRARPEPWITGQAPAPRVVPPAHPVAMPDRPLALAPRRGIKAGPPMESQIERDTREGRAARAAQARSEAARQKKALAQSGPFGGGF